MNSIEKLLEKLKPSWEEQERYGHIASKIVESLQNQCRERGIDADPVLVGSFAKDTNLRGGDLDIFIRFSRSYSTTELEKLGLELGRSVVRNSRARYAEHPYISGTVEGVKIDVVPCYRIDKSSEMVSSVDRTPLHTKYVNSHLSEEQKDDVRRLKLLLKSLDVYGSEIYRNGFSGYVCELLIDMYGSYHEVLRSFSEARGRIVIPAGSPSASRFTSPMVLIDPCDDDRNAAASVSLESLSKLKMAARLMLNGYDEVMLQKTHRVNDLDPGSRQTAFRIFRMPRPDLVPDTVYPQATKFRDVVMSILREGGFLPISSAVDITTNIDVLIECERDVVPRVIQHRGPSVDMPNSIDFLMKWRERNVLRGPYIIGDRLYVDIGRDCTVLEEYVMKSIGKYDIGKNLNQYRGEIRILDPLKDREQLSSKVVELFMNERFPTSAKIEGVDHLSTGEDL
ncbi:MAG: CCA tRNA nucleotidyltransferase [Candidatus Thermoplasmatota archaeon]|jgi:tRNA nucleotidyltransferase (CCA-adding enzyme)|nr:CCA tRNA nucleotidyltransferase [Candidatus Thermoplasmatota archaeon]MCL5793407.1 CCA tRNA nucleotidyltransferase [Candidatus Thermoplasmatota archaeon]